MPLPPGPIPAPYINDGQSVQAEWIDLNGHMNITFYLMAFDRAFDESYYRMGITPEALEKTGSSTFVAETHITYQRELLVGDPLRIETQLIGFDTRRMHWVQVMYHATQGYRAATAEWLILHVDIRQRRVATMPDHLQTELKMIQKAHALLPHPPEIGRRIDLENRKPSS